MSDIIEIKLRNCLESFLPIIDNNFKVAEKQWKSGELSKGAFDYINQRFVVAHIIATRLDIKGEHFFDIFSPITIDIKSGIELCSEEEKQLRKEQFKEWLSYFDEVGFTDRQPVFEYPMKNLNNFDKKKSGK